MESRSGRGSQMMLANVCLAIICGDCIEPMIQGMNALAPHSFPDLDDIGNLL